MISLLIKDWSIKALKTQYKSLLVGASIGLLTLGASQAASAITTKNITYNVDNQAYEGYYAKADKPNAPFILMIHDWDGVTDYERKRADMLAEQGYNVFAADMFGKGVHPQTEDEKMKLTMDLANNRNKMRQLLQGALNTAQAEGNNVQDGVTMGYCFGGEVALELARSGFPQKAFVPFHGGLKTPAHQDYSNTKGQILLFHGSADHVVPVDQFIELNKELEAANIPHEMTLYSGAKHAFTEFDGDQYDATADQRSWNRYLDFLQNLYQ
ncbi:dienelactone hydrolase family protein [Psychrobacter sp. FDAARGOS_221]|uniref:dienelactone hydrolase family protein n=1 Tax=Psychrobacter sp. FDAARGOS_221 TaxID=1975705 RepID=UPI000BB562F6|nr:dienelactone hydrolase family protein [Psychrobacter sp. FDAARGOS_221]PNK60906.1 dienelactone hydrolase [Psychrobacter sp. FDAARGOS_221]